jgi:hypothetical protein
MSEPTTSSSSLRRTTCLVAVLAFLVVIGAGVLGYPRIARRVWVLRNVDPSVRGRWLAIQEKLDAGGAWGTDEQACRMARAYLIPRSGEPTCEACVVELIRGSDGKTKQILVFVRAAGPGSEAYQYLGRLMWFVVGSDDPEATYDVKNLEIYIELHADGRLASQDLERVVHMEKMPGGAPDLRVTTSYQGTSDKSLSIERMNAFHRLGSPDPVFLPADAAPVGSRG